jgi:hypothetical protein
MQFDDETTYRKLFFGEAYRETFRFIPTQQEVWIYCVDSGYVNDECKKIFKGHGSIEFDQKGNAIDPPSAFVTYYEKNKDGYLEHTMLAAMILDSMAWCDDSTEARAITEKADTYIKEYWRGR